MTASNTLCKAEYYIFFSQQKFVSSSVKFETTDKGSKASFGHSHCNNQDWYIICEIKTKMNMGPLLKNDSFLRTGSYMWLSWLLIHEAGLGTILIVETCISHLI